MQRPVHFDCKCPPAGDMFPYAVQNPYFRRSHLSPEEFRELVSEFCGDYTAEKVAAAIGRQRNTINSIFKKLRERIADSLEAKSPFTYADLEGRRVGDYNRIKFIRGADAVGALDQMIIGVFRPEMLSSDQMRRLPTVWTEVLPDKDPWTIKFLRVGRYRAVQVFTYEQALRRFDDPTKIGVDDYTDTFFTFFSRRIKAFNGIPPRARYLHLKENEWRFNHRTGNRYDELLKLLAEHPL